MCNGYSTSIIGTLKVKYFLSALIIYNKIITILTPCHVSQHIFHIHIVSLFCFEKNLPSSNLFGCFQNILVLAKIPGIRKLRSNGDSCFLVIIQWHGALQVNGFGDGF